MLVVVVDGVAVRYVPFKNVSLEAGFFELDEAVPLPEPPAILLHSHPKPDRADPSPGDVAYARRNGLSEIAIFAREHDELRVVRLDADAERGYTIRTVVVEGKTYRARPVRGRAGRR